MTGADHEHTEAVVVAAQWYADQAHDPRNPAVPLLRERFGLSPLQACEAIAQAHKYRINRRAFG
jgi:hypothetical protein